MLFPHSNLDWLIRRYEQECSQQNEDPHIFHELARALLSSVLYHEGHDELFTQALQFARKALKLDASHPGAMITAGIALTHMEKFEKAELMLEKAKSISPNRADLHLALGMLYRRTGQKEQAMHHLEVALQLSPDAWELHFYMGRVLWSMGRSRSKRMRYIERSQYHFVQSLQRSPSPNYEEVLIRDIGVTCIQLADYESAEKFFSRLRDKSKFQDAARYYLGLVAFHLGKYKNSIQNLRQYLSESPDQPEVQTLMARAYLKMGDFEKAEELCNRVLLLHPENSTALFALGCSKLAQERMEEAVGSFRQLIKAHPGHIPAYAKLAQIQLEDGNIQWLVRALQNEVSHYDELPLSMGQRSPQQMTRQRLNVILSYLTEFGAEALPHMLKALQWVQDHDVRFQIWEASCHLTRSCIAERIEEYLETPGERYSRRLGRAVLSAAPNVAQEKIYKGLAIHEDDLELAVARKKGDANDQQVQQLMHRERAEARAYQAMLLVSLATDATSISEALLNRWASLQDTELGLAAITGQAMQGASEAVSQLRQRAASRQLTRRVDPLLQQLVPPKDQRPPSIVASEESLHCHTCERSHISIEHFTVGNDAVVCNHCIQSISQRRRELVAPDEAQCSLCSKHKIDGVKVYVFHQVAVCSSCLDLSLGRIERQSIAEFLQTW